jgi:hypothetical protein
MDQGLVRNFLSDNVDKLSDELYERALADIETLAERVRKLQSSEDDDPS